MNLIQERSRLEFTLTEQASNGIVQIAVMTFFYN